MALSDLNANFKEQFAPALEDLVPDSARLVKDVKFVARTRQPGGTYRQPVIVQREHGFTYDAPGAGATDLVDASNMVLQDAQILGNNLTLRSEISYERAARAARSSQAFRQEIGLTTEVMMDSIHHRLECGLWYGQSGLGNCTSSSNTSSTIEIVTFSAETWAIGIWSGSEGATLQFNDENGALIENSGNSSFVVTNVDATNKAITVTSTNTDSIDDLQAACLDAAGATPFFFGSRSTGDMIGLDAQITNTGAQFNINASVYGLWKSNTYATTGRLTMSKIFNAISVAAGRGLKSAVKVYVNPDTWANLASDVAANRVYDSSYKGASASSGNENLMFYSQNGKLEIVSHPVIKAGECFILPMEHLIRVGATDVTFNTPGVTGEENFFTQSATKTAYELRCYSNQGILLECPAQAVKITGFSNDV